MAQVINIYTASGVLEAYALKFFIYNERLFALTNNTRREETYSVTDVLTGLAICFHNDKRKCISEAKKRLNTEVAKKHDYSKHEVINNINELQTT